MKITSNWIGFAILIVAWVSSAIRFADISAEKRSEEDPDNGKRIIRILHWQLEPGYRAGMDRIIQAYNSLPHIKENRVEVRQMAVTERVYAQFLNVHLISGTAPDICEKGMSRLLGNGAQLARFFEPISGYVKEPNPYNGDAYLPGGMSPELLAHLDPDHADPAKRVLPASIDPELADYLQTVAWSETFTDGMLGGWDNDLRDYIAVPVSSWGAMRTFYNRDLTADIKTWLAEQWHLSPQPDWLRVLVEEEDMVTPNEDFLAWIESPEVPDSLGRFIIFCEAVSNYREVIGNDKLVAISASSYFTGTMIDSYRVTFTNELAQELDQDHNSNIGHHEMIGGWEAGLWSFQDPALKDGYFDVARWLTKYFPPGYLGLDREQAARRFINQNAIFITTGGWDASTLFKGAEDKFNVGVISAPMPVEGERWYPYSAGQPNEAENRVGAPMAVNKESRNFDQAIDFLRFMTSFSANQSMNQKAEWIPSVVGAQPNQQMKPFLPKTEGVKGSIMLNLGDIRILNHTYNGKLPLYMVGDISYEEFVREIETSYRNERNGTNRVWYEMFVGGRDRARQLERSMLVSRLRAQEDGWQEENLIKHNNILESSLRLLDGYNTPADFKHYFPEREFPMY